MSEYHEYRMKPMMGDVCIECGYSKRHYSHISPAAGETAPATDMGIDERENEQSKADAQHGDAPDADVREKARAVVIGWIAAHPVTETVLTVDELPDLFNRIAALVDERVRAEREANCKAVCDMCRVGYPLRYARRWVHDPKPGQLGTTVRCHAHAIRARSEGSAMASD